MAATADGGPSVTSKKNNLRLIVTGMVRQLAGYVQTACGGDMTNLLLSGFPVQKPTRAPIGVLAAPSNPVLALGTRSGELDASVNPVFGASTYNWKLTSSVAGAPVLTQQHHCLVCHLCQSYAWCDLYDDVLRGGCRRLERLEQGSQPDGGLSSGAGLLFYKAHRMSTLSLGEGFAFLCLVKDLKPD